MSTSFFFSKLNRSLIILLFIGAVFSLIMFATAATPNPGHDFTAVGGGAAQGDILYGSAPDTLAALPKDTSATRYLSNTGTDNNPAWAQVDLTNGVTGVLPAENGGTGNAFFSVSGPAGTTKSFTFPNASATVLTTDSLVTVAQGGTGATPTGANQLLISDSTTAATWRDLVNCTGTARALTYDTSTNSFGCNIVAGALLDSDYHTDVTTGTVARGDLITGQGASATWTRLPKGTANQVLSMDATATDVVWANPPGYALDVQAHNSGQPLDSSRYFGQLPKVLQSTANISKVYIPKSGTIKRAVIYSYATGTVGTAQDWSMYIRLYDKTTETLIQETLIQTVGLDTAERIWQNDALNIAVNAGDYFEIRSFRAASGTASNNIIFSGYVWIE